MRAQGDAGRRAGVAAVGVRRRRGGRRRPSSAAAATATPPASPTRAPVADVLAEAASGPQLTRLTLIDGLVVVDKPAGLDVARRRRPVPQDLRPEAGRPLGHARPRRHRRAAASASAASTRLLRFLTALPKPTWARSCSARRRRRSTPRATSTGEWDMAAVDAGRRASAPRPAFVGDIEQVPADGVGGQDRRQAPARAGPRGHRGRARPPRPVTVHRFDVRPDRRPAGVRDRGRVLVGHLHPHARRRRRRRARRRRAPAQPAPHRDRLVHAWPRPYPLDALDGRRHAISPADAMRDYRPPPVTEAVAVAAARQRPSRRERATATTARGRMLDGPAISLAVYEGADATLARGHSPARRSLARRWR